MPAFPRLLLIPCTPDEIPPHITREKEVAGGLPPSWQWVASPGPELGPKGGIGRSRRAILPSFPLCTGFAIQCTVRDLPPPTNASELTREHGKVLAQALAGLTRLDAQPLTSSYKRFLGSTLAGMIDYARKNSDLFEHTRLSFALDYDLRIPLEDNPGADADDETGRAVPEPVIEYLFEQLPTARVSNPASAGAPNDVYKAAFTCYLTLLRDAGRRPGETAGLRRECLSYDNTGQATLL